MYTNSYSLLSSALMPSFNIQNYLEQYLILTHYAFTLLIENERPTECEDFHRPEISDELKSQCL